MVPGTLLSEIRVARILAKVDGDRSSFSAYLCWIANAILQKRQIAFDGRQWYYQKTTRSYFEPIGGNDVPLPTREAMAAFLTKRLGEQRESLQ